MRSLRILMTAVALLAIHGPAHAEDDDKKICQDAYRSSNKTDDKLAACTRFIASNTGTPRERAIAHDVLGTAQMKLGIYTKALEEYTKETEADPTFVFGYFMRARMFRLQSQYDKAIEAANQALQVKPGDWQSLVERGRAYAGNGNLQAAAADFETATQSNPNILKSAEIQATLGLALNEKKDFAAAIEKFDTALKIDPNAKDAIVGRCDAIKVSNAPKDKLDECTVALLDLDALTCTLPSKALAADQESACKRILASPVASSRAQATAHLWLAADFRSGKKYDDALREYDLAIKIDPTLRDSYSRRAYVRLHNKGDVDGALSDLNEAIARNPGDFNALLERGLARRYKGDFDGSLADFDAALPHYPNSPQLLIDRAITRYSKKDYDGTIADMTQVNAMSQVPQNKTTAFTWLCDARRKKGDLDAALADCKSALAAIKFWGAYIARGNVYLDKGDLDKALADFNTAINIAPNFVNTYAKRGEAYERKKDFDNARADYQIAVAKTTIIETPELRDLRQFARQHLASLPAPAPPQPEKQGAMPSSTRVAMVIGNGAYQHVPALPNPPKDANAVAKALEGVGFLVVKLSDDMPRDGFLQALRAFSRDAAKADWAVIYYAGHGMEIGGVNYLIPIDAKLMQDTDAAREAVSLELVIASVSGAKKLRLVMLDACRDNPFAETMQRSISVQLVNKGLSNIEPDAGIMVVYATKHGETALDGAGGHSPFATAVINDIPKPGIEVRRLFDVVRDDVMKATNRGQQPFSYGSLSGSQEFYFVAGK